jgi:hypothetical protein
MRHDPRLPTLVATLALAATSFANLVINPDFSLWDDPNRPTGWTVDDTLATKTRVDRETTIVRSAPYSAKLTRLVSGTGNNYGLKQLIPVTIGRVYTLSAWYYDDNVDARGGISITWCRADTSSIGNTGVVYSDSSLHTWQKLTRSDTVPDSCACAKILARVYGYAGNQPNGFVSLDDVEFDSGMGAIVEERPDRAATAVELELRPNPTTGQSTVSFALARTAHVELNVYDLTGSSVAELYTGTLNAGQHRFPFAGRSREGALLPAGLYFLVLTDDGNRSTVRKVVYEPQTMKLERISIWN